MFQMHDVIVQNTCSDDKEAKKEITVTILDKFA